MLSLCLGAFAGDKVIFFCVGAIGSVRVRQKKPHDIAGLFFGCINLPH